MNLPDEFMNLCRRTLYGLTKQEQVEKNSAGAFRVCRNDGSRSA